MREYLLRNVGPDAHFFGFVFVGNSARPKRAAPVTHVSGYEGTCTARSLNPISRQQLENVVTHEHSALQAFHSQLPMNVFRHVGDDALLAVAELFRGRLRALLDSLLARLLEAQTHASYLSSRARGAGCHRPPPRWTMT
jgi:hypothetical protein